LLLIGKELSIGGFRDGSGRYQKEEKGLGRGNTTIEEGKSQLLLGTLRGDNARMTNEVEGKEVGKKREGRRSLWDTK